MVYTLSSPLYINQALPILKPHPGVVHLVPLTFETFLAYLRNALHYLYDPVHLRRNPLVELLGLANTFDPASALQQRLTETIRQLKPPDEESPQSNAWRIYDLLNLYYVRQYPRNVVATQLGVSDRQLRREQRLALEALAQTILKQEKLFSAVIAQTESASVAEDLFSAELGWLKNLHLEHRVPLEEPLNDVVKLAQPLSDQWDVPLHISLEARVANIPIVELFIRNILLTLLSVIIPPSSGTAILLTATQQDGSVEIRLVCHHQTNQRLFFPENGNPSLDAAHRLAALNGAKLAIAHGEDETAFLLTLPAPSLIPVLVIDDNTDWLDLLKRYAVGTSYQIISCREPEQALTLAKKLQPKLIILDVMMPNIDGWQIIGELRQEHTTSHIPIIVCSILPVEELALSLGVNAYLQKPITRDQFLSALNRQIGETSRPDHL